MNKTVGLNKENEIVSDLAGRDKKIETHEIFTIGSTEQDVPDLRKVTEEQQESAKFNGM